MNYWLYTGFMHTVVLYYCTYLTRTKTLSMLGTVYSPKIAKIISQQVKTIRLNSEN